MTPAAAVAVATGTQPVSATAILLPPCDCLNHCGDDTRIEEGRVQPCQRMQAHIEFQARVARLQQVLAARRAATRPQEGLPAALAPLLQALLDKSPDRTALWRGALLDLLALAADDIGAAEALSLHSAAGRWARRVLVA